MRLQSSLNSLFKLNFFFAKHLVYTDNENSDFTAGSDGQNYFFGLTNFRRKCMGWKWNIWITASKSNDNVLVIDARDG